MKATRRRLIIVTDVFELSGRAIGPLPVVPHALINPGPGEQLKPGDQLELRRPDGTVTKVKLCALVADRGTALLQRVHFRARPGIEPVTPRITQ